MKHVFHLTVAVWMTIAVLLHQDTCCAETVTTSWGGDATITYDTGFASAVMTNPDGGISLFNMELIENDAPGSGKSEKGVSSDIVWGKYRARKLLFLDDPRTVRAYLVIFVYNQGRYPLMFSVNGNTSQKTSVDTWDMKKNIERYRWTEFPAEWLKKGRNTIELFCPEMASEKEGWEVYLARADEFEAGGGDPADVGKSSFKSSDSGETWKESPFGPLGRTRAEYTIRLSLDRYVKEGWMASPVVDLWKGDSGDFIVPLREIQTMILSIRAEVPQDTGVEYYVRKGADSDPFSNTWEPYVLIGKGPVIDFTMEGADLNRRYVQFKAALSTSNPLKSPIVRSARITATLNERVPLPDNIRVVQADNPFIKYSSIDWEWERWDRPEFGELKNRENLDEVIAGSRTEFDAQVKLLHYVMRRWYPGSVLPDYPGWDALSILRRVDNLGSGGMCIQFNNVLAGLCQAYGWQARLVNCVGHEVAEVWNDEYGKWIFMDAEFFDHFNYDRTTCEPLNMLELHNLYLDYYFPDRPIDWMTDRIVWMAPIENRELPVKHGISTNNESVLMNHFGTVPVSGFVNAAFLRLVPRNNWFEKPTPRPLEHGTTFWPWDSYVNWYDERTPPKRQYSWHTDRPRDMWPDLNLVHVDATSGFGNDRLYLRFETYTPDFSHYEVDADDTNWKKASDHWTWLLQAGRNTLKVRAVSKSGVRGKPSSFVINHANAPFGE